MKNWHKAIILWGVGALLAEALLEWSLFLVAFTVGDTWIWFFPLVLFPMLLAVAIFNVIRLKSAAQRVLLLKYLTIYLPFAAVGPFAGLIGSTWQMVAQLASIPFFVLLPFLLQRKLRALREEEETEGMIRVGGS